VRRIATVARVIETDYLVVGAGLAGLAFTDALVAHSDADVLLVDRRFRPGGHWNDAYPFVRLHLPSAHYGVPSLPLGGESIDTEGDNAGMYERATGAEVLAYFGRVLDERLLPTGRVRFLGLHDYAPAPDGGHRLTSRLTGEPVEVRVRRKVVDATFLEASVPATTPPAFEVADGVRLVPVGGLVEGAGSDRYVVLGAGKTGIDAVVWLLGNGVPPDRVTWVRPRDPWLLDRAGVQPLDQVGSVLEGFSLDLEALAGATSLADLFVRLEERGRLLRIDPDVEPTMYHCATVSQGELALLRQVTDVVRLGRVRRIEPGRMLLDGGEVPVPGSPLYVDCTASALRRPPVRPVFEPGLVSIQPVRLCSPSFNSALIGYVEATRDDLAEQNRLCPPHRYADIPADWLVILAGTLRATNAWATAPDVLAWVEGCRTNLLRGLPQRMAEPRVRESMARLGVSMGPAAERLRDLLSVPSPAAV
jgi:hypothetical protein